MSKVKEQGLRRRMDERFKSSVAKMESQLRKIGTNGDITKRCPQSFCASQETHLSNIQEVFTRSHRPLPTCCRL